MEECQKEIREQCALFRNRFLEELKRDERILADEYALILAQSKCN